MIRDHSGFIEQCINCLENVELAFCDAEGGYCCPFCPYCGAYGNKKGNKIEHAKSCKLKNLIDEWRTND